MAAPWSSPMSSLVSTLKEKTEEIESYLKTQNIPAPSFEIDAPTTFPLPSQKIIAARAAILSATQALHNLVLGPTGVLMGIDANDLLCLQVIHRYNIASTFGPDEEPSFEDISAKCGLNVVDLRRVLRLAMTNQIFHEPRPGVIAHTAASRLLSENELVNGYVGAVCEEKFLASARTADALSKWGQSENTNQSGFSLGHNTHRGLYEELREHPERGDRWALAMSAMAVQIDFNFILSGFSWTSVSGIVVDVAGGRGNISIGLAQHLPNLSFIVQDFVDVIESAQVPTEIQGRVSFQTHNLFDPQPVHNAEVYYFRNVFHNWPDKKCVEILRNQVPGLKEGARLVIDDFMLHEPLTLGSAYEERRRRRMDINMLVYFGSRERTLGEWEGLLRTADPRFVLEGTTKAADQANTILVVTWEV